MNLFSIRRLLACALLGLVMVSSAAMAEDTKAEVLYPNATRKAPKVDLRSQKAADKLNEGLAAVNEGDAAKAKPILNELIEESNSKYVQAMAQQGLANLHYNQGDIPGAIDLMKKALANGVMSNDTYFQLMYGLVQFYVANEQYQEASDLLRQWRSEGKRETAESYALEGNIDYRLAKYPEAIAAIEKAKEMNKAAGKTDNPSNWDQVLAASYAESGDTDAMVAILEKDLAAHTADVTGLRNTVSLLIQDQRYGDATRLLEQAHQEGLIKSESDYMALAKLYVMIAQNSDEPGTHADKAWNLLEEGINQGTIEPGYDVYKLEGDAAYLGDNYDRALASYEKAVPFATDGEVDMRRAQLLATMGKNAQAIKLVEGAIKKGVKDEGRAYMLLGAANLNAEHRQAAITAVKKAATYPKTRDSANRWLKQAGVH